MKSEMTTLGKFKPAVPKCWLFAIGGLLWSGVGVMLIATAIHWLIPQGIINGLAYGAAGLTISIIILRQRFGRLALRNINRLNKLPKRGCVFAFQNWKSYLIILFMIALGYTLRHLPIPRPPLAVVYIAIGGSLVLGSLHYHRRLIRLARIVGKRRKRFDANKSS